MSLYTPDRTMVKKIKAYDPDLYVKWGNTHNAWEIWRKTTFGPHQLITPILTSVYEEGMMMDYEPLDERIIWWLKGADSWRHKNIKDHALENDTRWKAFNKLQNQKKREIYRDMAKDMYSLGNNFYSSKKASKNDKINTMNYKREKRKFVAPDVQTSGHTFKRTDGNMTRYNNSK